MKLLESAAHKLIPAGAVAVITDSPADAQHAYKVRFNDGAEAMLLRTGFSILKEFVAADVRRQETSDTSIPPRDLDGYVTGDFEDWQPFIIYRCVVGSQAFGLSGDSSDVDRRGHLPAARRSPLVPLRRA